jgi:hypothetical protein
VVADRPFAVGRHPQHGENDRERDQPEHDDCSDEHPPAADQQRDDHGDDEEAGPIIVIVKRFGRSVTANVVKRCFGASPPGRATALRKLDPSAADRVSDLLGEPSIRALGQVRLIDGALALA